MPVVVFGDSNTGRTVDRTHNNMAASHAASAGAFRHFTVGLLATPRLARTRLRLGDETLGQTSDC
jgi:hypothetical protein